MLGLELESSGGHKIMDRSGKNGMHKDEPVKDFVCIVAPSVTDKSYLVAMSMLID